MFALKCYANVSDDFVCECVKVWCVADVLYKFAQYMLRYAVIYNASSIINRLWSTVYIVFVYHFLGD